LDVLVDDLCEDSSLRFRFESPLAFVEHSLVVGHICLDLLPHETLPLAADPTVGVVALHAVLPVPDGGPHALEVVQLLLGLLQVVISDGAAEQVLFFVLVVGSLDLLVQRVPHVLHTFCLVLLECLVLELGELLHLCDGLADVLFEQLFLVAELGVELGLLLIHVLLLGEDALVDLDRNEFEHVLVERVVVLDPALPVQQVLELEQGVHGLVYV